MKIENFPKEIQNYLIPKTSGDYVYRCLGCQSEYEIHKPLYVCPNCGKVFLIYDKNFDRFKKIDGQLWRKIFDYRRMLNIPALKGIFIYHEFIGSPLPLDSIIYLGEGRTPIVEANAYMQNLAGMRFFFKNDGQNPSASFKDRGMASAFSYINHFVKSGLIEKNILAICASTGDTSAAAALYASYPGYIKSSVILPHKKVTPQQLLQPLGSGAKVFEIPGVFDDCMKVVEELSKEYNVVLLNSKNALRILGQESYSYEIASDFEYDMKDKAVIVPIGNAGNITAVLSGFIKFFKANIIDTLPKIIGVQSEHANPVYKYYLEPDEAKRKFKPIDVKPSVAQAAMIGNPVSMPRVIHMVNIYNKLAGGKKVFFTQVKEQDIMEGMLEANRNGHISCTHGGETLAGLISVRKQGILTGKETAIIDSTAHALKFSNFTNMYFENSIPYEYNITQNKKFINYPSLITPENQKEKIDTANIKNISSKIAANLGLKKR
jgi:threonine synthase